MYAPHVVSLINQHGQDYYLTILRGVMVQDQERRAVLQAGDYDSSYTKIFIPFGADAVNADGEPVTYLPPKQYAKSHEPLQHWTLQADGDECRRTVMKPVAAASSYGEKFLKPAVWPRRGKAMIT